MTRRDTLWRASELARSASDGLILARAFEGHNPARMREAQIEAEAALYAAIDLIWQSSNPSSDRSLRIAGEITTAPFETQALERAA